MAKNQHNSLARWRRFWLLCITGFVVLFGARLTHLQLSQAASYEKMAEGNRIWRLVQRAPRGEVRDRNGKLVAGNVLQYLWEYEENAQRKERIISDEEQAMRAMATAPAQLRQNYQRVYPYGSVLAHLIGYVQAPQNSNDVVFGRAGLERLAQDRLAGSDGFEVYERDAFGKPTRLLARQTAIKGNDIQLSIDAELSRVAFDALGDQRGAVIVSEPNTGKILAMVSKPSFEPLLGSEVSANSSASASSQVAPNIAAALVAEHNPFLFRPLAAVYPPGSLYKIVTALAGLEYQSFDENTLVRDEGVLTVGEYSYQNWYWRQYGRVEGDIGIVRALARSNDIFFYKAAEWIGPNKLADFSRLLGLGKITGIGFPGEQPGIVPDPIWKQRYFGEPWYLGNTYHMGIGQGDVLVTPLQLQVVMSTVATRGQICQPQFELASNPRCQELSLQEASLNTVKEGLREACMSGGTAYPFFTVPYEVLCKTGTAEFGAANEQGYRRTHGWFTVAVSAQPRSENISIEAFDTDIVITVLVESDDEQLYKEGSREAAPVALEIAQWWWNQKLGAPIPEQASSLPAGTEILSE
jgi:penicillin-binding protein 2